MQIIYEKNGQSYDMGTREGRREILGEVQCKPMLVYDESGELVNFYSSPQDMDKNAQLIKTIRAKFPDQPLRKAIDLFENDLLLKAQQEKSDLLKSQQPTVSKPVTKTSRSGWEQIDRTIAKLDAMMARNAAR